MTVAEAYGFCREVAKKEAKNFYWSFRVLPRAKSDAMCAVYAFMRRADDLADDESMTVAARREAMAAWLGEWRGGREDAVFVAVRDTQDRFGISDELLGELVQGTSMDLDGVTEFADFGELYRYCYLVASVVGLTSIRVFGYRDKAAELLAEKTGIAFQLTNILRDVKEDAERGRVYLPADLLAAHGVSVGEVLGLAGGTSTPAGVRGVVKELAGVARGYYAAAGELLPLIDKDSRAALWVMVEIYERLLGRVEGLDGDVFGTRASVPTGEKVGVLLRGAGMAVKERLL